MQFPWASAGSAKGEWNPIVKRFISWMPAFVVGGAAAVSGYLAVGMLLFEGESMFRALTVVLAVELGALALGLGSPIPEDADSVRSLQLRWVFLLVGFVIAAGFAVAWTLFRGFGGAPLTQGLGLALLGALPLYAAGLLLLALARVAHETYPGGAVAGAAALGASTGVLFTGSYGIARVGAPALLLFLLMLLSATSMIQAWALQAPEEADGEEVGTPEDVAAPHESHDVHATLEGDDIDA